MNRIVQDALTKAAASLRRFKKAAQDSRECGWELHPEEFFEPEDEAALESIEAAQAHLRGERNLFAQETIDDGALVDALALELDRARAEIKDLKIQLERAAA